MAKNCLIFETLGAINEMQQTKAGDGFMHLRGTFGVCGIKNNNARIYEAGNYGKMVAEMRERLKSKPILGELEHPQTMNITLENVSHKITDINIDENGVVSGEIVLLNTPKGKIAQAIVEGGAPLFISSRAQGSVDPHTSVVTLENLATYDLVGSPGFSQAELHLNEGQVAESICESCGYIYFPEHKNDENNINENMIDNTVLEERLSALESRLEDLQLENEELREQLESQDVFNKKAMCDGIQKWVLEEVLPEVQNYIVEEYSPEVQKWVVEEFSPEVQKWCQTEFAEGIQNWVIDECAPEFESWVVEHYGEEVNNKITEAVKNSKKNSLSNIEQTLTMLESLEAPAKPTYPGQKAKSLVTEVNEAKYLKEMPAEARVKYNMTSQEVKEAIDRRAKLFDFNRHTINEFWDSVKFDEIKPMITETKVVTDEREKAIRDQLISWRSRKGF
jgi:hypothetical protein